MISLIHSVLSRLRSIRQSGPTPLVILGSFGKAYEPSSRAHFTQDDASRVALDTRVKFYTTERLGPKQALTPEGFLVVYDVPIARTGEMAYGPGEIPLDAGPDGMIHVTRDADEVFRPEFMLSFVGKPIVDEHPNEAITPLNWNGEAVGTVLNPRRGVAPNEDLLLADFIIYDARAIRAVQDGKREVSCGYEAEYEATGPGRGRQTDMIGNHVALVEQGRCGPRCAIGDAKNLSTGDNMYTKDSATVDRLGWIDRMFAGIRAAFTAKDAAALDAVLLAARTDATAAITKDEGGESLHLHLGNGQGGQQDNEAFTQLRKDVDGMMESHAGIMGALDEIRAGMAPKPAADPAADEGEAVRQEAEAQERIADEVPEEFKKEAKEAKDSAFFSESFQDTVAMAEILVPGIQVPTYDAAAKPKTTVDAICKLRRTALDLAYATPEGRFAIDNVNGGKKLALDGMSCRDVRTLFRSAGAVRKATNNVQVTKDHRVGGVEVTKPALTPKDLNAKMAKHFATPQ